MTKRDIFADLMTGVKEMAAHRQSKITLRTHHVKHPKPVTITGKAIKKVREDLNCSRSVFACMLHTSARTLEKWEQGRAKPNAQAAALVRLVQKYPDTLERLQNVAG